MLSSKYRDVSSVVDRWITNLEIVSSRPARRLFFTRVIHLILSASSPYVTKPTHQLFADRRVKGDNSAEH